MMVAGRAFLFVSTTLLWLALGQCLPNRLTTSGDQCDKDDNDDTLYCGSNDYTYLNLCEYLKALEKDPTIKIVSTGECPCDPKDAHEWDPMCATDGQSYSNNCDFERERRKDPALRIRHLGLCNSLMKKPYITFRELQKVKFWKSFMPKDLFMKLSSRNLAEGGKNTKLAFGPPYKKTKTG